jgi:integrase
MKADLTVKLIKGLSLDEIPVGADARGHLLFEPNPQKIRGKANPKYRSSYILWDSNRESPPGFGVRVAAKKTYVLRRKVNGKSIMPTVGNFADFNRIELARARAADLARTLVETGMNPNELARKAASSEITLREVFARYRQHLTTRKQKPATAETLRVLDRVVAKHEKLGWMGKAIPQITTDAIEKAFLASDDGVAAKEQAFRTAFTAVRWLVKVEAIAAAGERREPRVVANPFEILGINKHFRAPDQIDRERDEQGKRNPLRPSASLGPFLEAAWSKRLQNDNETGIHYLVLMLLWGCRKSEHAKCVWHELLTEHGPAGAGRKTTSHICLTEDPDWGTYVFFHKTKNGRNHRLPLAPMALSLLKQRQVSAAEEAARRGFEAKSRKFAFPARNPTSKTGHYSDPTDLLGALREEIGIEKLAPHDLRRSFGAMMAEIGVPEGIQRRFLNHARSDVTDIYTQAEWRLLREWMAKIEQQVFLKAPNVYNALKPVDWPPIPAPPPHECRPPKPRTGRPRKRAAAPPAAAAAVS